MSLHMCIYMWTYTHACVYIYYMYTCTYVYILIMQRYVCTYAATEVQRALLHIIRLLDQIRIVHPTCSRNACPTASKQRAAKRSFAMPIAFLIPKAGAPVRPKHKLCSQEELTCILNPRIDLYDDAQTTALCPEHSSNHDA